MSEDSAGQAVRLRPGSPSQSRGQALQSSQDQAAGTGWPLRLLLDRQVPIEEPAGGSSLFPAEEPDPRRSCRPPASLPQAGPPTLPQPLSSLRLCCFYPISFP